jgi:hypothetical protein
VNGILYDYIEFLYSARKCVEEFNKQKDLLGSPSFQPSIAAAFAQNSNSSQDFKELRDRYHSLILDFMAENGSAFR